MLNNVSWANYWYTIAILLLIYYALILIFGYSHNIKDFLKVKKGHVPLKIPSTTGNRPDWYSPGWQDRTKESLIGTYNYKELQEIADRLHTLILQAAKRQFPREELILALKMQLTEYRLVNEPAFMIAINHFIIKETENNCSIHLSESEVGAIWVR